MKLLTILILFYAVSSATPFFFVIAEGFLKQFSDNLPNDENNEFTKLIKPAINTNRLLIRQICEVVVSKIKDENLGALIISNFFDKLLGCTTLLRTTSNP